MKLRCNLIPFFAVISSLAVAPAAQADMQIDNYSAVTRVASQVKGEGILGGIRTLGLSGRAVVQLDGVSESLIADGSWGGPATTMSNFDHWVSPTSLNLTGFTGVQVDFSAVNQPINLQVGIGNPSGKGWASPLTVVNQGDLSVYLPFSAFARIKGTDAALNLTSIVSASAFFEKTNAYLDVLKSPIYSVDNIKFVSVVPSVPEPEVYAMLLAGFGLVGVTARRAKNKQA